MLNLLIASDKTNKELYGVVFIIAAFALIIWLVRFHLSKNKKK